MTTNVRRLFSIGDIFSPSSAQTLGTWFVIAESVECELACPHPQGDMKRPEGGAGEMDN